MHVTESTATSRNPIQALREAKKKLRTPEVDKIITKDTKEFWDMVDEFIKEHGETLRNQNQSRWGSAADRKIKIDLFGEKSVSVVLAPNQQARYDQLKEEQRNLDVRLKRAFEEVAPYRRELYELCQQLSLTGAYRRFLDAHRLDPDSTKDPHPSNVRVLAAVSQHQGAVGNRNEEKISPYVSLISRLHEETDSMDDLIKQAEETVSLVEPISDDPRSIPDIQKPVSTPHREHNDAWKKSDNIDPSLRRIGIFIVADDGLGSFFDEAEELTRHYVEKPVSKFDSTSNPKAYRVDKIITVKPLTIEEEQQGIKLETRIKDAFREAELFAEQEIEASGGQDLKFEGIAHWLGHGMCKEENSPSEGSDRYYLEGSKEFLFITNHDGETCEGIDETTIKKLEREHLGAFRYFIQNISSCDSGAAIS